MKNYNLEDFDIDLNELQELRKQLEEIAGMPLPQLDHDHESWFALAFDESNPKFHSDLYRWARLFATEHTVAQDRETFGAYAGEVLYAAKTPIANTIGIEVGTANHNKHMKTVERCGFGVYIRSDHAFSKSYKLMPCI